MPLGAAAACLEVAERHAEPHAIRIARLLYEEEILPTDLEGLEEHTANLLGSGGFGFHCPFLGGTHNGQINYYTLYIQIYI